METRVLPFSDEAIAEAARLILAGEPVAVADRDGLRPRRRRDQRRSRRPHLRSQGKAELQPVDRPRARLRSSGAIGPIRRRGAATGGAALAGAADACRAASRSRALRRSSTAGLPTIGLRVPAHPAMQALLRDAARRSPRPRPTPAARSARPARSMCMKSLGGRIPLIIDGGATERGLESTIVAATGGPLRLLRPGPIDIDAERSPRSADRSARAARKPLRAIEAAAPQCVDAGGRTNI